MKKIIVIMLSIFCILITSCSTLHLDDHSVEVGGSSSSVHTERPYGRVGVNFQCWSDLFDFLHSTSETQIQILQERNFSAEDIERVLLFANKIKNYSLPRWDRGIEIEYITLICDSKLDDQIAVYWKDASYYIDYPSLEFDDYIKMGSISSYYQNAYPGYPRPDSYDVSSYKSVDFVEIGRNDLSTEAILIVHQYSAPRITTAYDDVILTFAVFGQGMGTPELIEMVNTAVIENGWEQ